MIMTILIGLILWATFKTANICYPVQHEDNVQLISRAQHLAKLKAAIDQLPDGYEKIQANKQWLKDIEQLMNSMETVNGPAQSENIVHLYQLRKS